MHSTLKGSLEDDCACKLFLLSWSNQREELLEINFMPCLSCIVTCTQWEMHTLKGKKIPLECVCCELNLDSKMKLSV